MVKGLRERQYQLSARQHEANLKYDYYRETARFFERESENNKQFDSWNSSEISPQLVKSLKDQKLRQRQSQLKSILQQEQSQYEKELSDLKSKKTQIQDNSIEALKLKLKEKKAEQSLYLPKDCRRFQSYFYSTRDPNFSLFPKKKSYSEMRETREKNPFTWENNYSEASDESSFSKKSESPKVTECHESSSNLKTHQTMYKSQLLGAGVKQALCEDNNRESSSRLVRRSARRSLEETNIRQMAQNSDSSSFCFQNSPVASSRSRSLSSSSFNEMASSELRNEMGRNKMAHERARKEMTGNEMTGNEMMSNKIVNDEKTGEMVQNKMSTNRMATNGTTSGIVTNGMSKNGMVTNRMSTNEMATNGIATNGIATNGIATNGFATNGFTTNGFATNGIATNGLNSSREIVTIPEEINDTIDETDAHINNHKLSNLESFYLKENSPNGLKSQHNFYDNSDIERSLSCIKEKPKCQKLSMQMLRYFANKDLKRQILDLAKREFLACRKQWWSQALRLREMRNKLELMKEQNMFNTLYSRMDNKTKSLERQKIDERSAIISKRDQICKSANIYDEEAKVLWKQWIHEDDLIGKLGSSEQKKMLLAELEKEWRNLNEEDRIRAAELQQNVLFKSELQDEHKLTEAIKSGNLQVLENNEDPADTCFK